MRRGYPTFWNPDNIRKSDYVPNLERAREEGRKAGLESVQRQLKHGGKKNLLIAIDMEDDFNEHGRLPVAGMYNDTARLCERLIAGTLDQHYTSIILTVDIHPPTVIHGDTWWIDEQGNPPAVDLPLFMVLVDDNPHYPVFEANWVDGRPKKKYSPKFMRAHTIVYAKHLQATGQGNIWVFRSHCRQGTNGINIVPALVELVEWMSVAREIEPMYMYKGQIAQVDWFGPFRPCMDVPGHPQGGIQHLYIDQIKASDSTEITGEAFDFCVDAGVNQVLDYYAGQTDVLNKISFIDDTTSAIVPSSDKIPKLRERMKQNGVRTIKHDTPFGTALAA